MKKKTLFSMKDLYDFSKPVKFSSEGFNEFLFVYQLRLIETIKGEKGKDVRSIYLDKRGNRFCFERQWFGKTARDVFARIVPEMTEVKL